MKRKNLKKKRKAMTVEHRKQTHLSLYIITRAQKSEPFLYGEFSLIFLREQMDRSKTLIVPHKAAMKVLKHFK